MTKKLQDLSWQADYVAEYRRTTGLDMSFGPAEKGGWHTVTFHSSVSATPSTRRMRRGEVLENTERLRQRPAHLPEVSRAG